MEAARRLFAQQPYDSVSTSEIAAAAGTTRTNIYYHFRSKRDLFLETISRFSRIPAELHLQGLDEASPERRVSAVLGRWLDSIERNREMFMTILRASSSTDPQVSRVLTESMQAWEVHLLALLGLDPQVPAHHAMIRAYQALIANATVSWLETQTLEMAQVHALLTECLQAVGRAANPSDPPLS